MSNIPDSEPVHDNAIADVGAAVYKPIEDAVTGWDADKARVDDELLFSSVSRPHTSNDSQKSKKKDNCSRPQTGPSRSREPQLKKNIDVDELKLRPKTTNTTKKIISYKDIFRE